MGLTTAVFPPHASGPCRSRSRVRASALYPGLTSTTISSVPLHGIPDKAVFGAEVSHDLEATVRQLDAEPVDGLGTKAMGLRRPDDRRSDVGNSRGGVLRVTERRQRSSSGRSGADAAGGDERGHDGLSPLARRRHELPHEKERSQFH